MMGASRRKAALTLPPPGSLVDIYARYSSDLQDGASLVTQVKESRVRGELHGWVVRKVWEEPETSAKYDVEDLAKRPQFAAMLAAAKRGECQAIICFKSDRWARNVGMSSRTLRDLERWGVWWETADGEFDSARIAHGSGKLLHTITAALNEQYSDTVRDHSSAGKQTRAEQGYQNAQPQLGYLMPAYEQRPEGASALWKPPRAPVRLDPNYAPIILHIGELFADGRSLKEVAAILNREGSRRRMYGTRRSIYFPDSDTVPWNEAGVFAVLRCVAYREYAPETGNGTVLAPDGTHWEGKHPAIWPYALWQRIEQQKAARRFNAHGRARTGEKYPFAGIVACAGCGNLLRSFTSHGARYHECQAKAHGAACAARKHMSNAATIESAFGWLLMAYRLGDTWRDDLRALADTEDQQTVQDSIIAQRDALEREKRTLNTMLRAGGIDENEYMREVREVNRKLAALPSVDAQFDGAVLAAGEALYALPEAYQAATLAEKYTILSSLLRRLEWDHDRQAITAIEPLPEYLPSLALVLTAHEWQQDGAQLVCASADPAIQPPMPGGVLSLAQQVAIYQRHCAGTPLVELAREYRVHHATIWRIARKPRRELRMLLQEESICSQQ